MDGIDWTPGIGDPTFLGWFTVFAYLFAGWLCLRAFMAEKSGPVRPYGESIRALLRVIKKRWPNVPAPARRSAVWLFLSSLLFALALNKQLDVQSLFTEIGRAIVRGLGWYGERRQLQKAFILMLTLAGSIALIAIFSLARGVLRGLRVSLMGCALIVTFVLIRAASFHQMDRFIARTVLGLAVNGVLELSGIALVALGAYLRIRARRAEVR